MILSNGEWITSADLPQGEVQGKTSVAPLSDNLSDNLKEALQAYEKSHIEQVLNWRGTRRVPPRPWE
jgi:transcriptional regulator with PAS, ATPase and Fis domain